MPEWLNGTVSKTVVRATVPRFLIPLSPLAPAVRAVPGRQASPFLRRYFYSGRLRRTSPLLSFIKGNIVIKSCIKRIEFSVTKPAYDWKIVNEKGEYVVRTSRIFATTAFALLHIFMAIAYKNIITLH